MIPNVQQTQVIFNIICTLYVLPTPLKFKIPCVSCVLSTFHSLYYRVKTGSYASQTGLKSVRSHENYCQVPPIKISYFDNFVMTNNWQITAYTEIGI